MFNGHANVIRRLNWLANKHALILYCLNPVNIFKRLRQIVNRNYLYVMRFHIYSKKFSFSLFLVFQFYRRWCWMTMIFFVLFSIRWHQWSQCFEIVSPIKSSTLNIQSRTFSKIQKYSKKYWNWLLAVNHFRKNISS